MPSVTATTSPFTLTRPAAYSALMTASFACVRLGLQDSANALAHAARYAAACGPTTLLEEASDMLAAARKTKHAGVRRAMLFGQAVLRATALEAT
jgi:hypothetical protein